MLSMMNFEVVRDPCGKTPLAALCRVAPGSPAGASILVSAGNEELRIFPVPGTGEVPLLGLRPATTYSVILQSEDGESLSSPMALATPALPDGMPAMEIRRCEPHSREPGFLLFAMGKNPKAIQKYTDFECVMALDRQGQVVWLYLSDVSIMGVETTARDTLLLMTTDGRIREIDWFGRAVQEWFNPAEYQTPAPGAVVVDTIKFHHAVCELPDGWMAALSIEFREVDDFPYAAQAMDEVSTRQRVAGDTIVEFNPKTGEIRKELRLLDILDPRRVGHHVMGPFWDNQGYPDCRDWSHQNSLVYDPEDDAYITTLRHQDTCCKIGRDGALQWLIAPPEGWGEPWASKRLEGLGAWPFHPHDPTLLEGGDVMLFDNGTARTTPPQPPMPIGAAYSRVVRYRIDDQSRTAQEVWSLGGPSGPLPYAAYLSGARQLPRTHNVAITCGGILGTADGGRTDVPPDGIGSACILEYTQTAEPRCVFEVWFSRTTSADTKGWAIFRSMHLREFYSGSTSVTRRND